MLFYRELGQFCKPQHVEDGDMGITIELIFEYWFISLLIVAIIVMLPFMVFFQRRQQHHSNLPDNLRDDEVLSRYVHRTDVSCLLLALCLVVVMYSIIWVLLTG